MGDRIFTREDAKSVIRTNSEKVRLPSDFTVIGRGSLAGFSQMKDLVIPEGVTKIESLAFFVRSFKNTSMLERLTIPSTLTDFGLWCFFDCNELKSISLPADFPEQKALELFFHVPEATLNFGKKLLFASKVKTVQQVMDEVGGFLTLGSSSMLRITDGVLEIPRNYIGITSQAMRNLANKGVEKLILHSGVRMIAPNAISKLPDLREVVFADGTEYIDNYALCGCRSVEKVVIPDSVKHIGAGAFMNMTSLRSLHLPADLDEIGDEVFSGCTELTRISFGRKITRICAGAFADCTALRSVMLPESVQEVGISAFWECKALQRLYIPRGTKLIHPSSLSNCPQLTELYMPRIIHDRLEAQRIFGDVTNPTITWLDEGVEKPLWSDDDLADPIDFSEPLKIEVPEVPKQPVILPNAPIHSVFDAADDAEKQKPVGEAVSEDRTQQLEAAVTALRKQIAELQAQAKNTPDPQPAIDSDAIADLNRTLTSLQEDLRGAASLQGSAAEISAIREQVSSLASVQSRVEEIAAMQESVQEKVDALSDIQEKVSVISEMQQQVEAISDVREKVEALGDLQETGEALSNIQNMAGAINEIQEKMGAISDVQAKVEVISDMQEKVNVIPDIQKKVEELSESQQRAAEIPVQPAAEKAVPQPAAATQPETPAETAAEITPAASSAEEPTVPAEESAPTVEPIADAFDSSVAFVPLHTGSYGASERVFTHEISKKLAGPVERSAALKEYTVIGSRAFRVSEGGERFEIPEGVRRIETQGFWDCPRLLALEIPNSLKEVEPDAFSGCMRLADVYLAEGFPERQAVEYFLFRPEIRLHWPKKNVFSKARVCTVEELAEQFDDILTPQKAKKLPVRSHILQIPEGYSVIVPSMAKGIDARVDEPEHILRTIFLPKSLRRLTARAFEGMESLLHIVMPDGLQIIDMNGFTGCLGPYRLVLPDSVSYIGPFAFAAPCQYEQIRLPGRIRRLPQNAFSNCNTMVSLRIPESVEEIGDMALSGCTALSVLTIPQRFESQLPAILDGPVKINVRWTESLKHMIRKAPSHSMLSVIEPKIEPVQETHLFTKELSASCANFSERLVQLRSHPYIAANALEELANQTKFEIPLGVRRICSYAFGSNTRLLTLTVPKALSEFEYAAFYGCQKLRDVFLPEDFDRDLAGVLFMNHPHALVSFGNVRPVRVRQLTHDCQWILASGDAAELQVEGDTLTVPQGYAVIASYMYHGIMGKFSLRRFIIPASMRLIGSSAFVQLPNLEEIVCEDGLLAIEPNAFVDCTKLKKVVLPATLQFLGKDVFVSCTEIESLTLPKRFKDREAELLCECPHAAITWIESTDMAAEKPAIVAEESAPEVEISEPATEEPVPEVEISEPAAEESAPEAEIPEPVAEKPAPEVEIPEPVAEEPAPEAEIPEPAAEEPVPEVEIPEPAAEEPTPEVEIPEPAAEEPAPEIETPEEIEPEAELQDSIPALSADEPTDPDALIVPPAPESIIPEITIPASVEETAVPKEKPAESYDIPELSIPSLTTDDAAPSAVALEEITGSNESIPEPETEMSESASLLLKSLEEITEPAEPTPEPEAEMTESAALLLETLETMSGTDEPEPEAESTKAAEQYCELPEAVPKTEESESLVLEHETDEPVPKIEIGSLADALFDSPAAPTDTAPALPEEKSAAAVEIPEDGRFTARECRKLYRGEAKFSIPAGYREIRAGACAAMDTIEEVTIPETVTKIGSGAFADSALRSIYIPCSVTEIADDAFEDCEQLSEVTMPRALESLAPSLFGAQVAIRFIEPVKQIIGDGRFTAKIRTKLYDDGEELVIPDGYTEIRAGACAGLEDMRSVVLPSTLEKICSGAFADCTALTSLTIPSSVTEIEEDAFEGCTALTRVTVPQHLADAAKSAFPNVILTLV